MYGYALSMVVRVEAGVAGNCAGWRTWSEPLQSHFMVGGAGRVQRYRRQRTMTRWSPARYTRLS